MARRQAVRSKDFIWAPNAADALADAPQKRAPLDKKKIAESGLVPPAGKLSRNEKRSIGGQLSADGSKPKRVWALEAGDIVTAFKFTKSVNGPGSDTSGLDVPVGTTGLIVETSGEYALFQSSIGLIWVKAAALRRLAMIED